MGKQRVPYAWKAVHDSDGMITRSAGSAAFCFANHLGKTEELQPAVRGAKLPQLSFPAPRGLVLSGHNRKLDATTMPIRQSEAAKLNAAHKGLL